MITGRDIVCLSTTPWEYPWGSRQQLMTRFARDNRVLFVEYQASVLHAALGGAARRPAGGPPREVERGLCLYTPRPGLPGGYYSLAVNAVNQRRLAWQLQEVTERLGFKDVILWVYAPCSLSLAGRLGEQLSVYHAIDLYKEETPSARRRSVVETLERRHVPAVDLVFASTHRILDHLRPLNARVCLLPSAADDGDDGFGAATPRLPVPGGPVAGFVGTIDERFDDGLMTYLVEQNPAVVFVLVGPCVGRRPSAAVAALGARPNVRIVDRVDRAIARDYIRSFSVCLVPYRKTAFTDAVSPVKVYEYLAAGKPTVAVALDGLEDLRDVVHLARDRREFHERLREALGEADAEAVTRRIRRARENTWTHRFETVCAVIERSLTGRG